MPEENKKDNLIDVGDADEAVTEVNLDEQQPKEAAQEEKIEVEQVEAKEEKPVEEKFIEPWCKIGDWVMSVSYTHLTLPTILLV